MLIVEDIESYCCRSYSTVPLHSTLMSSKRFNELTSGTDYMTDQLYFNVDNTDTKIDISLINAIRRTIMSDVKVPAIDRASVVFTRNSSSNHNGILARRLELFPVKSDYFETHDPATTNVSFSKINDGESDMNVFIKEFQVEGAEDISQVFVYPECLFTTLKPGEEVAFNGVFKISNSKTDGAVFNPAAVSIYTFERDQEQIEKKMAEIPDEFERTDFLLQKAAHHYKLNKLRKPLVYQFVLETVGQIPTTQLFRKGMTSLNEKLEEIKQRLTENRDAQAVKSDSKMDAVDFIIHDENETVGNLISTYHRLRRDVVAFSGYVIPHPEEKNLVIRSALVGDQPQSINDNRDELINSIDAAIDLVKNLVDEWDTVSGKVKQGVAKPSKTNSGKKPAKAVKSSATAPAPAPAPAAAPETTKKKRVVKKPVKKI